MTMIRMTIEVESIEDAIQLLNSERLAEEARTNANGFYNLLRSRIKHQNLPENDMVAESAFSLTLIVPKVNSTPSNSPSSVTTTVATSSGFV